MEHDLRVCDRARAPSGQGSQWGLELEHRGQPGQSWDGAFEGWSDTGGRPTAPLTSPLPHPSPEAPAATLRLGSLQDVAPMCPLPDDMEHGQNLWQTKGLTVLWKEGKGREGGKAGEAQPAQKAEHSPGPGSTGLRRWMSGLPPRAAENAPSRSRARKEA